MDKSPPDSTQIHTDPHLPGVLMSEERRAQLRLELEQHRLDHLDFDAVTYRHQPNRNHVSFRRDQLAAFAASFRGAPFLRNHDHDDIGSRDGTVIASELVGDEFLQTIRLTTQRGMKDFTEGIIDRFSIAWNWDSIECSVCNGDWLSCEHYPGKTYPRAGGEDKTCSLTFINPTAKEVSAVNTPAVPGTRILERLAQLKEQHMQTQELKTAPVIPVYTGTPDPPQTPEASPIPAYAGTSPGALDSLRTEIADLRAQLAAQYDKTIVRNVIPVKTGTTEIGGMQTPLDRLQDNFNWLFGDRMAKMPAPNYRSLREMYTAITGDVNFHGKYQPEYAQLTATTTTLANLVVNALNRVTMQHFDNMLTYRWYEPIVDVMPHDGSTQTVTMVHVDGVANLASVTEGAAYTELTVGDSKETMAFTKYGHYVGITLEAIRKSDIARLQAIPREMVKAAIRTRSAAISLIFTQASGTGPTMADDSTVLFHADHGNVATTAFDAAGWAAIRTDIYEQTLPGTSKPLGLWPSYCLVPIELYDTALTVFGYGAGDVGRPIAAATAQEVNPYAASRQGDPRPTVIAVPDWTDATDWAAIVDPRIQPVIHMAYANAPQGGSHPGPEIYEVMSETSGLLFTNDTLPVKVRDWFAYGVSTHVGVAKMNVA